MPLDGGVRVAGVQAAEDPKAKLLVEAFGKDPKAGNWIQATPQNAEKDKEFPRGSVVNFVDDAEFLVENGSYIDKSDSFRFYTGITVVDMRGGERIAGRDLTRAVATSCSWTRPEDLLCDTSWTTRQKCNRIVIRLQRSAAAAAETENSPTQAATGGRRPIRLGTTGGRKLAPRSLAGKGQVV